MDASPRSTPSLDAAPATSSADEEALYAATVGVLAAPEKVDRRSATRFWFLLGLGLFLLWQGARLPDLPASPHVALAVILGVLLFHEAGHFAGMRLFGYRDVKLFFIPFFGAAVTGLKHAAPSWQRCVVVLMGPLPGLVAALGLQASLRPEPGTPLHFLVLVLLSLNLFNLLPLVPLDGGRVLQIAVFSRHPVLETGFLLCANLGLGAVGLFLGSWVLQILAVLGLIGLPSRFAEGRRRSLLRKSLAGFPQRLEDLDEDRRLALFLLARKVEPAAAQPAACAARMRSLHEEIVVRPPSAGAALGLVAIYVAGIAIGEATMVLMAMR